MEVVGLVAVGVLMFVSVVVADLWSRRPQGSEGWREFAARRLRFSRVPRLDWEALAGRLGLEHPDPDLSGVRMATGTLGAVRATLSEDCDLATGKAFAVALEVAGVPEELVLRAEDRLEALKKTVEGEDVQLLDAPFDAAVNVHGPEDVALSVLGSAGRQAVQRLVSRGAVIKEGRVRLELPKEVDLQEAEALVRETADDAACIQARPVAVALAENAAADPVPGVRLRNLKVLLKIWGKHEAARRAIDTGLADPDPEVRLLAAKRVEDERALPALRTVIEDVDAPPAVRSEALDEARQRRASWLFEVACAAAEREPAMAAAAARALADLGDERAEPTLAMIVGRDSGEARREAVVALGAVGSVKAVPALTEAGRSPELAEAARNSIRAIQSRLAGAEAGGLSVAAAAGEAGALSVPVSPVTAVETEERDGTPFPPVREKT